MIHNVINVIFFHKVQFNIPYCFHTLLHINQHTLILLGGPKLASMFGHHDSPSSLTTHHEIPQTRLNLRIASVSHPHVNAEQTCKPPLMRCGPPACEVWEEQTQSYL